MITVATEHLFQLLQVSILVALEKLGHVRRHAPHDVLALDGPGDPLRFAEYLATTVCGLFT
jgi:hypothetical protein